MEESVEVKPYPPMWVRRLIFLAFVGFAIGLMYFSLPAENRDANLRALLDAIAPIGIGALFMVIFAGLAIWAS